MNFEACAEFIAEGSDIDLLLLSLPGGGHLEWHLYARSSLCDASLRESTLMMHH